MKRGDITSCFYVLGCSQRSGWSKMPAQREAWCSGGRSSCWNVSVATTFSTPYILVLLHRANTQATCSYVMMLCGSLFASSLAFPLRRSFVLIRKGNWYRRRSRSRRVEDAHVQLFGHFVVASQLRYSRQSRTPLGIPTCISQLARQHEKCTHISCVAICRKWYVRILYSIIIVLLFSCYVIIEKKVDKIIHIYIYIYIYIYMCLLHSWDYRKNF